MGISKRIADAREAAGLTQQQLADAVRVSQPTVAGWESGVHAPLRSKMSRFEDATAFIERDILPIDNAGPGRSQEAIARMSITRSHAETVILAFLARADGVYRPVERTVIADFLIARHPTVAQMRSWVEGHVGRMSPTSADAREALKALPLTDRHAMEEMLQACAQLVAADGDIPQSENQPMIEFIDAVRSVLPAE